MIPNVTRGGRARGLLRYLTAPKEQAVDAEQRLEPRELHTNPHLVAGSGEPCGGVGRLRPLTALQPFGGGRDRGVAG